MGLSAAGCLSVPQNGGVKPQYFRAKQNAERLHGGRSISDRVDDVQSTGSSGSHTLIFWTNSLAMQKNNSNNKKAQKSNRPSKPKSSNPPRQYPSSGGRSQPLAQTNVMRTSRSRITTSVRSDGRIVVKHREFIRDIGNGADAAFGLVSLSINPGLDTMFIWLSSIANNYEFYEFRKLAFEYVPTCSAVDSGGVMLAVDFDAGDHPPTTKQEFMSYLGSTQGAVWNSVRYVCDAPDLHKFGRQKFTRPGNLNANKDVKTYDIGNFYIATTGVTSSKGSLYVDYEVELSTPHVNPVIPADHSGYLRTTTSTKADPFAGAVAYNGDDEAVVATSDLGTDFKILEPGEYLVDLTAFGTGLATMTLSNILTDVAGGGSSFANTSSGAVNAAGTLLTGSQCRVKVTHPTGSTFRLATGGLAWTTLTSVVLKVLPWMYTFAH